MLLPFMDERRKIFAPDGTLFQTMVAADDNMLTYEKVKEVVTE